MTAADYIAHLALQAHPEGGFYRKTYRAAEAIEKSSLPSRFTGSRSLCTAIYYLLQQHDFSAFHRIHSDECWHFYAGQPLLIHAISAAGHYTCTHLGAATDSGETFQHVVPAGSWFAAEPADSTAFALVGCTVAPGFDFADFEMAARAPLTAQYPQHTDIIARLTRE